MGLCSGISHFRSPRRPAADLASPLQLAPARNGPGTVGVPVVLAGVSIASGDIVIGDGDGVVVVPRERAEDVAKAALPFLDNITRERYIKETGQNPWAKKPGGEGPV